MSMFLSGNAFGSSAFDINNCNFSNFNDFGKIDMAFTILTSSNTTGFTQGMQIINPQAVIVDKFLVIQVAPTNMTFFSILTNIPSNISIKSLRPLSFFPGDSLLFLDPNSPDGTIYTISECPVPIGNIYQIKTDIVIDNAESNSGRVKFITNTSHGLVKEQVVVLSGFSESTYNGTFIVQSIESTTEFTILVSFTSDDAGNLSVTSLDSTDVKVLANQNITSPDSMFTGISGLELFNSEVTTFSLTQNEFEIITSTSWLFTELERFSDGVVNTGQLICDDPQIRKYTVAYSGTIRKSGGGSVNIGIIILKNGSVISFNPPHTVNTGKIQISHDDIIELTKNDTLDIAVINYDASATAIDISQLSMIVSRA